MSSPSLSQPGSTILKKKSQPSPPSPSHPPAVTIRPATLDDVAGLVQLEQARFESDRLSARNFRHLLTKGNATTLLAEEGGQLLGYATVLYHAGTSLARLYSIAVTAAATNRGLGRRLLAAAEGAAKEHDCAYLRLEVRHDNHIAQKLYRAMEYRPFALVDDYYEDHMAAIRFEKILAPRINLDLLAVPYYRQTLDFTCGPAALIMAMQTLDPTFQANRNLELRLWREATTIFMTSGHGGCSPFGLALAAHHRGFEVELTVSERGALLLDSVRSSEKREVMRLVQEEMLEELRELKVAIHHGSLSVDNLRSHFEQGAIPIVLISSYRIYQEKSPHWVVVCGFDDHFVYVHDSYVDVEKGKSKTDCVAMPIARKEFSRMARYGKTALRAVLIVRRGAASGTAEGNHG